MYATYHQEKGALLVNLRHSGSVTPPTAVSLSTRQYLGKQTPPLPVA